MTRGVQSATVFLVAFLSLGPLLLRLAPCLLPTAARAFWLGIGKAGRAFAAMALIAIAGLSVSKGPVRSMPPAHPSMPEWFTALGYDPTDTDGDGASKLRMENGKWRIVRRMA